MKKFQEKVDMSPRTLQDFEWDVLEPLCSDARKAGLKGDNMKRACNQAYSALVSKDFGVVLYNFAENKKSRKSLNESYDFSGCSGIPELTDTFAHYFKDETESYFKNLDPSDCADIGRALIRVNNSQMKKESTKKLREGLETSALTFTQVTGTEPGLAGFEGYWVSTREVSSTGNTKTFMDLYGTNEGIVTIASGEPEVYSASEALQIMVGEGGLTSTLEDIFGVDGSKLELLFQDLKEYF